MYVETIRMHIASREKKSDTFNRYSYNWVKYIYAKREKQMINIINEHICNTVYN